MASGFIAGGSGLRTVDELLLMNRAIRAVQFFLAVPPCACGHARPFIFARFTAVATRSLAHGSRLRTLLYVVAAVLLSLRHRDARPDIKYTATPP